MRVDLAVTEDGEPWRTVDLVRAPVVGDEVVVGTQVLKVVKVWLTPAGEQTDAGVAVLVRPVQDRSDLTAMPIP